MQKIPSDFLRRDSSVDGSYLSFHAAVRYGSIHEEKNASDELVLLIICSTSARMPRNSDNCATFIEPSAADTCIQPLGCSRCSLRSRLAGCIPFQANAQLSSPCDLSGLRTRGLSVTSVKKNVCHPPNAFNHAYQPCV